MVLITLGVFFYNLVCALYQCEVSQPPPHSSIADIYNYNTNFKKESGGSSNVHFFNRRKRLLIDSINETELSPYDEVVKPYPIIWTLNGAIQGYSMGTVQGRRVFAFEGIPYAEPPVGELRFKAPVPKSSWQGILKAHSPGHKCLQGHPINLFRVMGSENCLTLSIYVPMILKESIGENSIGPIPVIVWIHGGSFAYGSGSEYGPAYMLDQDVILITINYRLGALGFLSTGDLHSPGNYGLKDQALALKWVHDNIAEFGGNPQDVLLMGESAGGVSANLHAISNKTREYFQRGFSLSASAFCHWGVITQRRAQTWTSKLAQKVQCPNRSNEELMTCLRKVPSAKLVAAQLQIFDWTPMHPLIVFAPVVEPEGPDAFLTQSPKEAYTMGNVAKYPWMFSFTSQEGHFELYVLQALLQLLPVRRNLEKYLPYILDYHYLLGGSNKTAMNERVMRFYNTGRDFASLNSISQMYTDRYFVTPVEKAIRQHSKIAPVYASIFDFKGKYNVGSIFGIAKQDWGIPHGEDNFYYFNSTLYYHGFSKTDKEYQLSSLMTNLVSNFAKTRIPIYKYKENKNSTKSGTNSIEVELWSQIDPLENKLRFLHLSEEVKMITNPFDQRIQFWNDVNLKD